MEVHPLVREVQDLTPLIAEVVKLRHSYSEGKSLYDESYAEWLLHNDFAIQTLAAVKRELEAAESSLRGEALANYTATGDKQVAPGIVIRVNHRAVYNVKVATDWSLAHGGVAHVFDSKVFEKLAQASPGLTSDFVSIEDVPIATLAKDLGKEDA